MLNDRLLYPTQRLLTLLSISWHVFYKLKSCQNQICLTLLIESSLDGKYLSDDPIAYESCIKGFVSNQNRNGRRVPLSKLIPFESKIIPG